jgi:hypothetical protein
MDRLCLFQNALVFQNKFNYCTNLQRLIGVLNEYRTSLISDVVTGRVNVQNISIPNYTPEILNDELENGIIGRGGSK